MQVDQGGAGIVVAHPCHEFTGVRARVGGELIAGVPQIVEVNAGQPSRHPEAVLLKAEPPEPLYQLRLAVYETSASVLGPDKFSEPRPEPGRFMPHISAAYVNSDGPVKPIADAIRGTNPEPVTVTFRQASLLVFHRDHRMYEWTKATPLPVGATSSPK